MSAEPNAHQAPWTIGRLLNWTTDHFTERSVDEPRLCAEILLAHAISCERIHLYTRFDEVPEATVLDTYRELVRNGAKHTPIAYLVGYKEFFSLTFEVTPDVLIPRPETETLVECAAALCRECNDPPCRMLDLGTGSGCVAITLATQQPEAVIIATDLSAGALSVAARNAAKHNVADRVTFAEADRLHLPAEFVPPGRFHLIVSNPPYVAESEMGSLPPAVRDYEPAEALTPGGDGLGFYRAIATDAPGHLANGGHVLLEIGAGQRDDVSAIMTASGAFTHTATHRSPASPHDRVLHFTKI